MCLPISAVDFRMAVYVWNRAPFVRLLPPLAAGILLQWNLGISVRTTAMVFTIVIVLFVLYSFLSVRLRFKLKFIGGILATVLVLFAGCAMVWVQDVRNSKDWIGRAAPNDYFTEGIIDEPPVEKPNSYRAILRLCSQFDDQLKKNISGRVIIYFQKSFITKNLHYGSSILFHKKMQRIQGPENPNAFDYARYCLFQGLTHQVYLAEKDFVVLPHEEKQFLNAFVFHCRSAVVGILKKFIRNDHEAGLAEALLIGYKQDLDPGLVQSYANTGVVHVIAISGLHLGLVYGIVVMLTRPLKRKKFRAIRFVLILASLWLFSLMAGAQPSVLRSAVMFSFIAAAEASGRHTNIYNNLALSAFVLLCIDPFWLWDAGFQLSYLAVLSIIIFYKPVYHWFVFKNRFPDIVWQLNAVTIAAQLLTLPVSIYHFHQVPVLFLFTNLVAVPLSSLVLIGEIILCVFAFLSPLAAFLGLLLNWMIWSMNAYIQKIDAIPFASWHGLSIGVMQTILLTCFILAFCNWLLEKRKGYLFFSLLCLLHFCAIRTVSFIDALRQKKIIVFNIPKITAVDLVDGRKVIFAGDSTVSPHSMLYRFHIQPSRITGRIASFDTTGLNEFRFFNKQVTILDTTFRPLPVHVGLRIDLLILSRNAKINLAELIKTFVIHQVVIDSSVPDWKATAWKNVCDSLHVACYHVGEKGAFVLNL